MKTLIVYYSRTITTKILAQELAEKLSADTEEITCEGKYGIGAMGYMQAGKEAISGKITALDSLEKDPKEYGLVIIGGPLWSWNVCPPVRTYCREQKEKLSRVAFFTTMGSSEPAKIFKEMQKECGLEPLATIGLTTKEVRQDQYREKLYEFIDKLN